MIQIDMSMPKNCRECSFKKPSYDPGYCDTTCSLTGSYIFDKSKRCKDCPLIEVKGERV